ncbi:MAG TPA: 2OG-Fe(II) oxygenase [Alphaproteobacteria bacterium]|nr:2OG-Fe(II) oxygenase [Alphaproteobacteria bacterium]
MALVHIVQGVQPGDLAPGFVFSEPGGRKIGLAQDDVAGHFTILCFLGLAASDAAQREFEALLAPPAPGAPVIKVFVIGGPAPIARAAAAGPAHSPFPVLADPEGQCRAGYLGAVDGEVTTFLLAPNRHVMTILTGEGQVARARAIASAAAERQGARLVRTPHAPVLIVPDVLGPADRQYLLDVFATQGQEFIECDWQQEGGNLPPHDVKMRVTEYGRFDRVDHFVANRETNELISSRFQARLFPEIKKAFQYDITRYEPYRIACYEGERGGRQHGHRDDSQPWVAHRRFAVSVNLNAEEFEGGELRYPEFGRDTYRPDSGAAIAFSCSVLHEALPVTKGRRFVLLAFLHGET